MRHMRSLFLLAAVWAEVTSAFPSPEEVEKLVCKVASSEMVEKRATKEVCNLINEHFPSVKMQPDCESVVGEMWDAIKARCPKPDEGAVAFPSPEEIEELVCKVASSEMVEKKATDEVCKLIQEHFPSVKMQPDCATVVGSMWDDIKAHCPKGKEVSIGFPSPEEIEELVCKVASSEMVEKKATDEVCKLIQEHFPSVKMQPDCATVVGSMWDDIKAHCPKGKEVSIGFPSPAEIEELVCKVASSEMVEKKATDEVCKLIQKYFPSVKMQPDCATVVGSVWDDVKAHCPKGNQASVEFPSPEEIEKLVCKVASSEAVEKEATGEVCKLISKHFPAVKMQPDCETVVSSLWDAIKARCPEGKESIVALPSPEEVEKLVCKLASSEAVEKEATEEVCHLIKEHFPSVKMQPDCESVVDALWDKIKAQCPKGRENVSASLVV